MKTINTLKAYIKFGIKLFHSTWGKKMKCKTCHMKNEKKVVGIPWNESLRFKCDTTIMFGPYCLKWGVPKLGLPNVVTFQNNPQGFKNKLLSVREGEIAKAEGNKLKIILFE
jgi:hypothetical protein